MILVYWTDQFECLRTENNGAAKKVEARTEVGKKRFFGLAKLLGSLLNDHNYYISTLIRTIVVYGVVTRAIWKTDDGGGLPRFSKKDCEKNF